MLSTRKTCHWGALPGKCRFWRTYRNADSWYVPKIAPYKSYFANGKAIEIFGLDPAFYSAEKNDIIGKIQC